MFDDKYPYRSSMSKAVMKSFFELSKKLKKKLNQKEFWKLEVMMDLSCKILIKV